MEPLAVTREFNKKEATAPRSKPVRWTATICSATSADPAPERTRDETTLCLGGAFMSATRSYGWMMAVVPFALSVSGVSAQSYPDRPIRIVCSQIGGINDFFARLIAQGTAGPLGQPIIVENRATLVTTDIVV